MHYEARAYATREEIIGTLSNNLGAQRSERRQRESSEAIQALNVGAMSVVAGRTKYIVVGEPQCYVAELSSGELKTLTAGSDTEAWQLAWTLAPSEERIVRLYRAVEDDT